MPSHFTNTLCRLTRLTLQSAISCFLTFRVWKAVSSLEGWVPPAAVRAVLPFNAGQIQTFAVVPWQLGLAAADSIKGPSKIVYIPYRSEREPLDLLFCPGARPGDPVGDWSTVHAIGMGESSACRTILECTLRLGLDDLKLLLACVPEMA